MGMTDKAEGLNTPKCTLTEAFDDVEGRLSLLTGLIDLDTVGLTIDEVRRPVLIIGLPGIGKTCGLMSIRNKFNNLLPPDKQIGFKKILLGQTVVGSMTGIPVVQPDGSVIRVQMPDLPDEKRDGKYGILFLDELTTADEAQVQPALGLCDDSRNIGEYTLPENWLVVAAGNGPDCTNFVRLDDMTISRFTVYDIAYDYKTDWRPWAHENDVESNIIAFLNFDNTACVRVESTDMDSAGKLFPNPRTWERLSTELKMRRALGKPIRQDELANFAGRIVGTKVGREYAAFCIYDSKVDYDPDKIINGTERNPVTMEKQTFQILLQACLKQLSLELKDKEDMQGNYPADCFTKVANFINWFLMFEPFDLESTIQTVMELRNMTGTAVNKIAIDRDFADFCPNFNDFMSRHVDYIIANMQDISNL